MNKFEINIGLFGAVSVGKSTFLNAVSGQHYSDAEIKKTTMVPQVYIESENEKTNAQIIRRNNREINETILRDIDLNKFNLEKCQPLYHNIDKLCDLFDPDIIDPNLKINIYDIPGLNDSASKNIYFEWVKQNIKLFDIIIFMTDINRGLNNSDEIDILNLLMDSMKKYNIKMICLMNKCDDIYFDQQLNDLVFEEKEQENIYIQANDLLVDIAKKYGFECTDNYFTPFFPISSENCFIYRALMKNPSQKLDSIYQNRLCKNECGPNQWKKMTPEEKDLMFEKILLNLKNTYNGKILDTGYLSVKAVIQNTIIANKLLFAMNHIENDLKELEMTNIENISTFIKIINKYVVKLSQIKNLMETDNCLLPNKLIPQNETLVEMDNCLFPTKLIPHNKTFKSKFSYTIFWKNIQTTISNYIDSVNKLNIKIMRGRDYIDFKEFELLHSTILTYCMNLATLIEIIQKIPEYPNEFINNKQKELVDKLLNIYNQLCSIDPIDQVHVCPTNISQYLEIIKTYVPDKFDTYSLKFLELLRNPKCKHAIAYENELGTLIIYISDNISKNADSYRSIISTILINKQQYIQYKHPEQYFPYLVKMKKIIKKVIRKLSTCSYSAYDILYEVTNKHISLYLGTNSITNIYKQEIDHVEVDNLLNKFLEPRVGKDINIITSSKFIPQGEPNNSFINLEFERGILNAFIKKNGTK
jgi:small GTP-binding protein